MLKTLLNKSYLAVLIAGLFVTQVVAQDRSDKIFPHKNWTYYDTAEQAGFIQKRLAKVEEFYNKKAFSGLLIVKGGAVAVDWGENIRRFPVHSIRKSMLSALYGVHSANIDLQVNLKDLEIDDNAKLTELERSARLLDILTSRSGIYLPAAAEAGQMVSNKPERGSHSPGSHWWYNNWNFNVAGSIYTQLTGEEIPNAFKLHIADPLQMQDFREFDGYFVKADSEHQAVQFRMSSRDLARLGLLYLRNGNWRGQQIIPQDWIETSTQAFSQTDMGKKYPPNYGYMWWVGHDGSYSARGVGGHILAVYPDSDMVVVLRVNTYLERSVSASAIKKILEGIVSASVGQAEASPNFTIKQEKDELPNTLPKHYQNISLRQALSSGQLVTLNSDDKNIFLNFGMGELELRHLKSNQFVIIDRQEPLEIDLNLDGEIAEISTPRLFYLQAAHAAQQGDLNKALHWVKEVIVMLPESAMAYTNMAKIYIAQNDFGNAKLMLDEALKFDPQHKQANNLKLTITTKQWLLPGVIALGVVLIVLFILKIRRK